jgi:hypothetical protein
MNNRDDPLKRYFRSNDALRRYAEKVREQERAGVWEKEAEEPLTDEAFQAFQERLAGAEGRGSEVRNKYGLTPSVIILGILVFIGLLLVGAFIGPGF